ncbi:MAG: SUMF1/EgtB/PvdO family nonheme iron enzyme [Anaerolineae bacterium]|nr:SUMF1/EgtB/PvdO family nonheme iron enzyme [Anaerolineae bacterium]
MNKKNPLPYALFLIVFLVAACGGAPASTPTPAATPTPDVPPARMANRDWRPVYKTVSGFEMVEVPAGCITLGTEEGRRDERPPAEICFNRFWIDRLEVTNAQYGSEGAYPGPKRPRENLTWFDARDFCAKRGGRLPTEAEWEYAARGPSGNVYPWGNNFNPDNLNFDQKSLETSDVGSFPLGFSWVGALDMSGNVWEWTSSIYRPYPYDPADGREDPNDTTSPRVFRGGWLSNIDGGTSPIRRFRLEPGERDWRIGFRCVMDQVPE